MQTFCIKSTSGSEYLTQLSPHQSLSAAGDGRGVPAPAAPHGGGVGLPGVHSS